MAIVSGFARSWAGLMFPCDSKLKFGVRRYEIRSKDCNTIWPTSQRILRGKIQYFPLKHCGPSNSHVLSVGRDHYQLSHADLPQEPFWLCLVKEAFWGWKSLFVFLVEQPSQLKYLEWPTFQSTLKTAILSLVLVAMFIVALSSVDSVLCFLLALLLRRTP